MRTFDVFGLFGRGPHLGVITSTEGTITGGLSSTAKAAAEGAYTAAKQFQDAVNSNVPGVGKNAELAKYERDYNESFDTLVREGGEAAAVDAYNDFKDRGINKTVLVDLRPKLHVNKYTGVDLRTGTTTPGATGGTTQQTTQQTTTQTSKPTTQPAKPVASTDQHLPPPGGPHNYEEEYQQYQYQQEQYANRPPETPAKSPYRTSQETLEKAYQETLDWMKKAGISQEYAPVKTEAGTLELPPAKPTGMMQPPPSDVASVGCDPMKGQFPDGHGGCRGSVATGGYGNLMNVASMAPAMTSAVSLPAGFLGQRFPVKNI